MVLSSLLRLDSDDVRVEKFRKFVLWNPVLVVIEFSSWLVIAVLFWEVTVDSNTGRMTRRENEALVPMEEAEDVATRRRGRNTVRVRIIFDKREELTWMEGGEKTEGPSVEVDR